MLDFVEKGNNIFIVSSDLSGELAKKLGLTVGFFYNSNQYTKLLLVNKKFKKTFYFRKKLFLRKFSEISDTAQFVVLGLNTKINNANFIKKKIGKGNIFINLQPLAFTNYHILYSDYKYVANTFSYLPDYDIVWDSYNKPYNRVIGTPLEYILSQKALKFAYYILIFSLLLYMISEFRRKQRAIPVITPPKNDTLDFVKTIAYLNLYKKDYTNISKEMIKIFLEKIREKYFVKTNKIDDEFFRILSEKTGKSQADIQDLFNFIFMIKNKEQISKEELIELNNKIENFEQ